jgi:DNA processing protein
MPKSDTKYWIGFSLIPGVGRAKFAKLESYFGTLEQAWQASPTQFRAAGLEARVVQEIMDWRPRISLETEMERLDRYGVAALTWKDPGYPARLKEIYDCPPLLYVRGQLLPQDEWCLAVVGTRKPTLYGRQVTQELASELARRGVTIVSGLARGVDAEAHRAALEVGGRTLAIFACGLDIVYPSEHARLAQQIMSQGALLSDYPLGTRPKAEHFPRRNRIMSGLSLGTLIIEAGETSGALITARLALEQNREVFAVPGSILSPASQGTNRLIQDGAKLVRSYTDVLEELNLTARVQPQPEQLEMKELLPVDDTEAALLKRLSAQPTHIDEVCRESGLPISVVSSTMALLEIKGLVRQVGAMNYVLAGEARAEYKVKVE